MRLLPKTQLALRMWLSVAVLLAVSSYVSYGVPDYYLLTPATIGKEPYKFTIVPSIDGIRVSFKITVEGIAGVPDDKLKVFLYVRNGKEMIADASLQTTRNGDSLEVREVTVYGKYLRTSNVELFINGIDYYIRLQDFAKR